MLRRDLPLGRVAGAVVALLAGGAFMVTEAAAVLSPAATDAATIELSDDDAAAALFTVTEMAPGHPTSSCMAVTYTADGPTSLRLHATTTGTGLDRGLHMIIDQGRGGRFGDCSAFVGTPVYQGTMADFVARHHDFASGLSLDAVPSADPIAYRFTVDVLDDDSVQGTDTEATFTWEAHDAPPPPVTVPTPDPTPNPTPTTSPASPTAAATAAPTVATPPVEPEPPASETRALADEPASATVPESAPAGVPPTALPTEAEAGPTTAEADGRSASAPPASRRPASRLSPVDREDDSFAAVLGQVVSRVIEVTEKAAFPGGLLAVAALFLLVQDRIDRKDPKLALAPVHPDPDLRFDDAQRTPRP